MENTTTISQIMTNYFYKRGSLNDFCKEKFPNDNYRYKARTLMRYQTGERIPSYQVAKELLSLMEYEISDRDLIELLKTSRNEKIIPYQKEKLTSRMDISYGEILKNTHMSNEEKLLIIKDCLKETQCKNIKEFIIKLIDEEISSRYSEKE